MASTSPSEVRETLSVDSATLPDAEIDDEIAAAELLVENRLDGYVTESALKDQIATLVAADILYPRVSGSAKGEELSSIEEGSARVSFANSTADSATGNSAHWQTALKLDYSGRLDGTDTSFEVY